MIRVLPDVSDPTIAAVDGFGRRTRGIDPDSGDEVEVLELSSTLVRYDVNNAAAIAAAKQNQLEWVTGLRQETRETIQQVIVDGHARGANPREVARDIRD